MTNRKAIKKTEEQMIREVTEASVQELIKFTKLINDIRSDLRSSNMEKVADASISVCVLKNFIEKDFQKRREEMMLMAESVKH